MRKHQLRAIAVAVSLTCLAGQTRIDLQKQSRRVDFSQANATKPIKAGTAMPATCEAGELFLLLPGTPGSNVYVCGATNTWTVQNGSLPQPNGNGKVLASDSSGVAQWSPVTGDVEGPLSASKVTGLQNRSVSNISPTDKQTLLWDEPSEAWKPGSMPGSTVVQAQGIEVGNRPVHNHVSGSGIFQAINDTGAVIDIQYDVNTAVIQTQARAQSGMNLLCASAETSGGIYSCTMTPTLTTYTPGMVVHWKPAASGNGSAVTIDIDHLGPKPVKRADGATNPGTAEMGAGRLHALWYDGTAFRLPANGDLFAPSSSGLMAWTGSALTSRTLTGGTGISVTNGDGVAGSPTVGIDGGTAATHSSVQSNEALYVVSSGTGTAYTGCPARSIFGYTAGMTVHWQPNVNGTGGATTIDLCTLGAKAVQRADGSDPQATDIVAGRLYGLWYDGTAFRLPAVTSVLGRTGAVVAASNDYTANQVANTPGGGISATDVQAALNELDTEKAAALPAQNATTRHKALVSSGVTGLEAWRRLLSPGDGRRIRTVQYDDSGDADQRGSGLRFSQTGAPAATHIANTATAASALGASTGTTADSVAYQVGQNKPLRSGWNVYFETKVGFSQPSSGSDWGVWVGLVNETAGYATSGDPESGQHVAFRYIPYSGVGDTEWKCVTKDGATQTVRSSGVTFSNGTRHRFAFLMDDTGGNGVSFWIDGIQVCTDNPTSNLPNSALTPYIAMFNMNSAALAMGFAWEYLYTEADR